MIKSIPYEKHLSYTTKEFGPLKPRDLSFLFDSVPLTEASMTFHLDFFASRGVIPGTSAEIRVVRAGKRLSFEEFNFNDVPFHNILSGGKIERLSLSYPGFKSSMQDAFYGAEAFQIVRENKRDLRVAGYYLDSSSFALRHHLVECTRSSDIEFYSRRYQGKVVVATEELVQGKPDRKIVLSYTSDLAESEEVKVYSKALDLLRR